MVLSKIIDFCQKHIFALIMISYFIITSGLIYDLINEPPATGQRMGADGIVRSEPIQKGQNGQYSLEGFAAGSFFLMIRGGMILIDIGLNKKKYEAIRNLCLLTGAGLSGVGILFVSLYSFIKFSH